MPPACSPALREEADEREAEPASAPQIPWPEPSSRVNGTAPGRDAGLRRARPYFYLGRRRQLSLESCIPLHSGAARAASSVLRKRWEREPMWGRSDLV
jgi:hypothetical protein